MNRYRLLFADGGTRNYYSAASRDANAQRWADETGRWVGLEYFDPSDDTWYLIGSVEPSPEKAKKIRIKTRVDNTYELYDDVTVIEESDVPYPPAALNHANPGERLAEELAEWEREHLKDALTGVGHTTGKSWYDVEVLESSEPLLIPVGYVAQFGDY